MNQPRVVAIAGSCTTRDNFNSRFNPDYKRWFSCDLAANQSSMIAMMSPPVDVDFEPLRPMSDYDRWNVASDLSREFVPKLLALQPDYLILDFFADVHFGVLRMADGRYVTNNRWKLWHTDFYRVRMRSGELELIEFGSDPDAYFQLWTESIDRFAALVRSACPATTVVVHRGYNARETLVPGSDHPVPLRKHKKSLAPFDVRRGNQLWARLDDYAIDTHGWQSIDLRHEGFTSVADHPWGPFYVHYSMDYYHRFLAELLGISIKVEGPKDVSEAVAHIRAAYDSSIARQRRMHSARLGRCRKLLATREARVAELEELGLYRSVKFSLGQKIRRRRWNKPSEIKPQESR